MTVAVVIPARLHSTRLPRKVLLDIVGQSMLQRVHDVAVRAECGPVRVVTDSPEVAEEVESFGGRALMSEPSHPSGTARIASVLDHLEADVVVNIQGDAPLTPPDVVARAAAEAAASGAQVTLPVYPLAREEDVFDPGVVKVVRDRDGRVLYCSRSPIPHIRDVPDKWLTRANFWGHAGLYAYSRDFLRLFPDLPVSPLEEAERLEQLRWLEAGLTLHSFEVGPQGPSVDTPNDLERVRGTLLAGDRR